jgi:hypothetical protein
MAKTKLAQGIYKCGNTFWYRIQENGKRRAISLATDDVTKGQAASIFTVAVFFSCSVYVPIAQPSGWLCLSCFIFVPRPQLSFATTV